MPAASSRIANLRGGGEYGEAWHQAGNLTPSRTSSTTSTAAAAIPDRPQLLRPRAPRDHRGQQRRPVDGRGADPAPELFRAVVSHVGIYDMLRFEVSPNGAFNVTEFGTVKDPEQFKALYAYSPYHHVKDGRIPGRPVPDRRDDPRVDPASRKMSARLQAAVEEPCCCAPAARRPRHRHCAQRRDRPGHRCMAFLFDQLGIRGH